MLQISGEKQRAVLQTMMTDFCKLVMGNKGTMYDISTPTIANIHGEEVSLLRYLGDRHRVLGTPASSGNIETAVKVDQDLYKKDQMPGFEGCLEGEKFLNVRWTKKDASCVISDKAKMKRCKRGLLLTYVLVPGDSYNVPKERVTFEVELTTKGGKTVAVSIPPSLWLNEIADGELSMLELDGYESSSWSQNTPPGTVNIPFDTVGLDGEKIKKVTLKFTGTEKGSIAIWDMEGY